ncbi:LacI family DNA-binding transcriptional regulator [Microbacterium sp. CJ88]|uniref:LacI family DNA-binding transcriptional regulator n=1 Tax=Microbacterium sp. CJ88 TaxID=3445672 RepID=UPI003F6588F8
MSRSADGDARRASVRDVAERAGVSTQTVSRVINDHPHIRDDTRRRVREAMAALDYRVNNAARALGTTRTRTIGVIASDSDLYGPAVGIAALEAAARAAGRWIATAYAPAGDAEGVEAALAHVRAQGVDGIVLVAAHARSLAALEAADHGLPLVALHGGPGAVRQREGAAAIVAHLVERGHRRIARIGGPADWIDEVARAEGFAEALAAHGLDPSSAWSGDWSAASAAALAPDIVRAIREPDGPTAIVAANDQMGLGLLAGLRTAGLDVPGDIGVAGFDDNPDAAFYRPGLTTVRLDVAGEAARCVAAVIGEEPSVEASAPVLVVRASTGGGTDMLSVT